MYQNINIFTGIIDESLSFWHSIVACPVCQAKMYVDGGICFLSLFLPVGPSEPKQPAMHVMFTNPMIYFDTAKIEDRAIEDEKKSI